MVYTSQSASALIYPIVIINVCFISGVVHSYLAVHPQNTTVFAGQRTQLNCSTSDTSTSVNWQHIPQNGTQPYDIYINKYLVNSRFQMETDKETGKYNVIIPSVEFNDAGVYSCIDDEGRGVFQKAYLSVVESTSLKLEPTYLEGLVNETAQLNCTTHFKDNYVNWQHIPVGEVQPKDVYISQTIVNTKFKIDADKNAGAYNLIIEKLELENGGLYHCIDRGGMGDSKASELTVIGGVFCNDLEINSSVNASENVTLTCNVTFSGNVHPQVKWRNSNGYVITEGVNTTLHFNRVTSILHTNVDIMNLPTNYTIQTVKSQIFQQITIRRSGTIISTIKPTTPITEIEVTSGASVNTTNRNCIHQASLIVSILPLSSAFFFLCKTI